MRQQLRMSAIRVIEGWLRHMQEKPRAEGLPVSFTSSALATIQVQACFNAGKTSCAYWAAQHSIPETEEDPFLPVGHTLPAATTQQELLKELVDTPCKACKSPGAQGVQRAKLYAALFPGGGEKDQDTQQRNLRRYMYGDNSIHYKTFLKILANAWVSGWLTDVQARALVEQTIHLSSATSELRKWRKKLTRNKKLNQESDGLLREFLDDVEHEEQNKWCDFFSYATRGVETNHAFPAPLKQELLDVLTTNSPQGGI